MTQEVAEYIEPLSGWNKSKKWSTVILKTVDAELKLTHYSKYLDYWLEDAKNESEKIIRLGSKTPAADIFFSQLTRNTQELVRRYTNKRTRNKPELTLVKS